MLEGDLKAVAASGGHGATEILAVTHAWMTADAFEGIVNDWIKTARHPKTGLPYDKMIYQPMVELMDYLRDNRGVLFDPRCVDALLRHEAQLPEIIHRFGKPSRPGPHLQ